MPKDNQQLCSKCHACLCGGHSQNGSRSVNIYNHHSVNAYSSRPTNANSHSLALLILISCLLLWRKSRTIMNSLKRSLQRVVSRRSWERYFAGLIVAGLFIMMFGIAVVKNGSNELLNAGMGKENSRLFYDPEGVLPRHPTCESFNRLLQGTYYVYKRH